MKKLPKKYAPLLTVCLMSLLMAFVMTFFVTAINFGGFPPDFLQKWWKAFSHIIFIVFPVILIVRPLVEKMVKNMTE